MENETRFYEAPKPNVKEDILDIVKDAEKGFWGQVEAKLELLYELLATPNDKLSGTYDKSDVELLRTLAKKVPANISKPRLDCIIETLDE